MDFLAQIDVMQILSAFIVLFAIIDILGSTPIILNLQERGIKVYAFRATSVSLAIMIAFLFAGDWILQLFNVDIRSFAVAGALVLFLMALEMILDIIIFQNNGPEAASSIVPIAFPLIAGPGSFTALLSLRAEYHILNILIALFLNLVFVFIVLHSTKAVKRLIGDAGVYIMRKFFGIILLAISVKLFATNLHFLLG